MTSDGANWMTMAPVTSHLCEPTGWQWHQPPVRGGRWRPFVRQNEATWTIDYAGHKSLANRSCKLLFRPQARRSCSGSLTTTPGANGDMDTEYASPRRSPPQSDSASGGGVSFPLSLENAYVRLLCSYFCAFVLLRFLYYSLAFSP